ncbi:NIPSNAP family protein [Amycolatopsis roodepoortensis]|uniref:Quinol monooxygenase YgiN n=1 Tax=Amycolatopsis roodepoortensis TaxID=700274 RepID=A0ABR9KY63_9PSEU|nr:NIPSNAP family protein [Amycolatopsis roodepoortensis]MBE1573306.1 quinol monooxygenase YgiN [Amycolatopsis roodepoortensis]
MTDSPEFQSVVELRRYTLHPGRRDELIELFEREFVETQEACGMRLFGLFREPAEPDKFVWLRGFRDMESRRAALESFYYGPVWRAHGPAANETMIDASDVLLLRPSGPGFPAPGDAGDSRVLVTVCHPIGPVKEFSEHFAENVAPALRESGVETFGHFETEPAENTFPRLPVREGETVFVWFAKVADEHRELLARTGSELASRLELPWEQRELTPTARSALR